LIHQLEKVWLTQSRNSTQQHNLQLERKVPFTHSIFLGHKQDTEQLLHEACRSPQDKARVRSILEGNSDRVGNGRS
jgi:hypothetical protein